MHALIACLALLAPAASPAAEPPETQPPSTTLLTGERYPIEVSISFSAALFHWLDSLAGLQGPGMSAGKTIQAHRRMRDKLFGRPSEETKGLLRRYGEIRRQYVLDSLRGAPDDGAQKDPSTLLVAFLGSPDLESALKRSEELLEPEDRSDLRRILDHFAPEYEQVWNDGKISREFLRHCLQHERLDELEDLLVRMAEFFGVDPTVSSPVRLVLMPVSDGYGTHAQANGRYLLIELRPWEKLHHVASVIVHENAHWLFKSMDEQHMTRLAQTVRNEGETAVVAANHLREALPTAMGQGIADRMFRPLQWSTSSRWYHTDEVDSYAKRIYPIVKKALAGDDTYDEAFLRRMLALYPSASE